MHGFPLTLTHVLRRMGGTHAEHEVVAQLDASGATARASFGEVAARAARLASGLRALGIEAGDRVGSFAWNSPEHLEAYYAVPCSGAILHTLNLRLFPEQVAYTIDHAGDRAVIVDASLVEEIAKVAPLVKSVERFVVTGDAAAASGLPNAIAYDEVLALGADSVDDAGFDWPELDENAGAALCYTSGTTGNPKGVLYSHRTLSVHTLVMSAYDAYRLAERDRVLAVVPMFHAMGWNLPYVAGLVGCDMILPGRYLQAEHLARLIEEQRVTASSGVPTIWMDLLRYADEHGTDLSTLENVICGGTQVPPSLIRAYEERHDVAVVQGWGMTEVLPGAAIAHDPPGASEEERWERRNLAGRVTPFYEIRVVDDDGAVLPSDGEATGEIEIRGVPVATEYYRDPEAGKGRFEDGWLRTGDVGSVDPRGWMRITDRAKDVIKSGGEWISSVDLESALMEHPAVATAAVIALPDERWSERPLACVVAEGVEAAELREFLADRVAKWWLPDEFAFLEAIPLTSTGKFDKKELRAMLAEDRLPGRERVRSTAGRGSNAPRR
jgi:fatty-acyl-CoA synthase